MGSTLNPFELSGYKLDGQYIAQVVNNNDPLKMGRVQISLPILWGNETPWAVPKIPQGIGGSSPAGYFSVPNNGSNVFIELQNGDVHFPFYVGTVWVNGTVPPIFQENYPTRYGFIDEQGTYFVVDRTTGTAELFHKSGTYLLIREDGNVVVNAPKIDLGEPALDSSHGVVRFSDLQAAITNHTHPDAQGGETGNGVGVQTASSVVFAE